MRLQRIVWKNYRRLPDAEIEVRKHLVLVGPNDSGKSSVLRAVNLCLGISGAQLGTQIEHGDFTDPEEPLVIQVVLNKIEDIDRAAFPDEISTLDGETLTIEIRATMEGGDPEQKQVNRLFPDAGHVRAPTKSQFELFGWAYVRPIRSLFRELGSGSRSAVSTLLSSVDLSDEEPVFDAVGEAFGKALQDSKALGEFRDELSEALSGALPKRIMRDDLKLVSESEVLDDPLARVTVAMADGEYSAPISEQSDGIRALTVLSLYGLEHRKSAIVGIDEPETHLHHTAQRVIAARLQDSPGQRLLVTHSPAIVREMSPLDIVTMGADRVPRQLKKEADIAELEASTRHWSNRLIEPLTARRVLMVEGPSDRIVCERAGQLIEINLNRMGVAILELDGSSLFPRAYRLFGPDGFNLPISGLLDEDARVDWAEAIGYSPADIESDPRFQICVPSLEGVYVDCLGVKRTLECLIAGPGFSEGGICQATGMDLNVMTKEALSDYCNNKKRKVTSALAIAAGLTKIDAEALGPITKILRSVGM